MSDMSLTPKEVAEYLKIAKNTVYEMIKRGELQSFKVGRKIRIDKAAVEALKQNQPPVIDQQIRTPAGSGDIIICGQDIILDILTRCLEAYTPSIRAVRSYKGSYNGLFSLYHDEVNVATAHLWEGHSNTYNLPYVQKMLPGMDVCIVHLVKRIQGLYVKKGNPKNITDWVSLQQKGVTMVNREKGSGTRVLLDEKLRILQIPKSDIRGYDRIVTSHSAAASMVCRGMVDTAPGSEKGAALVAGIDFIPLQTESYDMIFFKEHKDTSPYQAILAILNNPEFQEEISGLGGYDISDMGKVIWE
ncbi:helix-turn-helix transcriptional regulator [Spirochaeta cellobiosiphila]|uniref:helix-turn-helix transcriptional regulator n=1 Tax=Spirochaeta cellobiosiphila TaxID=504483 RepID=UPI0003FB1949|nr:helix-turn-helix transcriptional regulator [Spirochaeta cellobiosiphila]